MFGPERMTNGIVTKLIVAGNSDRSSRESKESDGKWERNQEAWEPISTEVTLSSCEPGDSDETRGLRLDLPA